MTGYIGSGANPLSRLTVRSLTDLGYTVNVNNADPYIKPITGRRLRGDAESKKPRHRMIGDSLRMHRRMNFPIVEVEAD